MAAIPNPSPKPVGDGSIPDTGATVLDVAQQTLSQSFGYGLEATGHRLAHGWHVFTHLPAWAGSLVVHAIVLLILSTIYLTIEFDPPELCTIMEVEDLNREQPLREISQELDNWRVDSDAPVTPTALTVAETATSRNIHEQQISPFVEEEAYPEPMSFGDDDADLSEVIKGVQGAIVQTHGDVGAIDRITMEIVNRLREKKVVVAWLLDASESLRERREQVIARFDRIYTELNELTEPGDNVLLTSISAFGEQTHTITKEPTADRAIIRKAVRDVAVDESGVENVFAAIRNTALAHRRMSRKGYEVMIVVLTDECGNDFEMLDDAILQVKRNQMPVFVLGPTAPFGQHEVKVPWTDPATEIVHRLPVERGPESIRFETSTLPTWNETLRDAVLPSGFGAFGLSQVTRETGGIYFLHNDAAMADANIDLAVMLSHLPDYVSASEYAELVERSPIRKAVLRTTDANRKAKRQQPTTKFLASAIQFGIRDDQKTLMEIAEFLDRGISELQSVEQTRDKEASPRWRAHYDMLLGRLLANRQRLNNSLPLLNEMYAKPKPCSDGTTNAWELTGREGSALRDLPTPVAADSSSKSTARSKIDDAELAVRYLRRVETEHAGTPWAVLASVELETAMEFEWREAFMTPPAGEKLPWDRKPWSELTDKQKEAKKKFERFQVEKKMKQKERAAKAAAPGTKHAKIPKL